MLDLIVAGGGPVGLAIGIHAALRGMDVRIVEPRPGVLDKACGEGLMPSGVRAMTAMGVVPERSRPFAGIRYVWGSWEADGDFPSGPGLGVRRTVLHAAMRARAEALGVPVVEGRVDAIVQEDDRVRAAGLEARWLVAADGLMSSIRRSLDLEVPSGWPARYGLRRHFAVEPWSDRVEVHWDDLAEAYVTPVDDRLVGIALLFGDEARDALRGGEGALFDRLLDRFPALRERLRDPATSVRGAGPFARSARTRVAGRVLLAGDAGGYLDPLTGEGLRLGFEGAEALVARLAEGRPEAWEEDWKRLTRDYFVLTGGLLRLRRHAITRRAMIPVLRMVPPLFGRVLDVLGG